VERRFKIAIFWNAASSEAHIRDASLNFHAFRMLPKADFRDGMLTSVESQLVYLQ